MSVNSIKHYNKTNRPLIREGGLKQKELEEKTDEN